MGIGHRFDGIEPCAVQIIRRKARQLVGQAGFTKSDVQDLEQELMVDLLRRMPKYDPARAKRQTFVARVVDHGIATIIEARKAQRRDYRLCQSSLNERLQDGEGGTVERGELVDQEDYLRRTGRLSRPESEQQELRLDVCAVIEQLPPDLREFCRRLRTDTVTDISRDTGVPRSTLYEHLRKARAAFEDQDLQNYL